MTNTELEKPAKPFPWKKLGLGLALGIAGGVVGYTTANLVGDRLLGWEDELASLMAVVLIATGIISAWAVARRPSDIPSGCGWIQISVLILSGALFLIPIFGLGAISPAFVMAFVAVLMVTQTALNIRLWTMADEMLRRVILETSALAFVVLQSALFLYAAAERLGLVETVSGWGLMGITMVVYLAASFVASIRRGMT